MNCVSLTVVSLFVSYVGAGHECYVENKRILSMCSNLRCMRLSLCIPRRYKYYSKEPMLLISGSKASHSFPRCANNFPVANSFLNY